MAKISSYAQALVTVAIIITVFCMCQQLNSSSFVFTDYRNYTGFPTAYCLMISIFLPLASCHDGYIGFCQVYEKQNKQEMEQETLESASAFSMLIIYGFICNAGKG
jgi:hypothetical protein